jgi:hypothetical protein
MVQSSIQSPRRTERHAVSMFLIKQIRAVKQQPLASMHDVPSSHLGRDTEYPKVQIAMILPSLPSKRWNRNSPSKWATKPSLASSNEVILYNTVFLK